MPAVRELSSGLPQVQHKVGKEELTTEVYRNEGEKNSIISSGNRTLLTALASIRRAPTPKGIRVQICLQARNALPPKKKTVKRP